jgi:hypothetical protein
MEQIGRFGVYINGAFFMTKFTNPLSNVKIASPCSQDWSEMIGTERKRFCSECKLDVHNLSGMTQAEAENLLFNSEGRLCVRFFRRADGSVLTKDCPVGWQALKQRVSKTTTAFASLVFAALSGIGLSNYFAKANEPQMAGTMLPEVQVLTTGKVSVGTTKITNQEKYYEALGGMSSERYIKSKILNTETMDHRVSKKHKR